MTLNEKIIKIDKTYEDLKKFVSEEEYEYGAMVVRTIVEIIVNSYTDYYTPEIKKADQIPTIMEQIEALNKCNSFNKTHIYNLHEMRKISNKGSHQGKEESISAIQIKAMLPVIEEEIKAWKIFADEGHESLIELDRLRKEAMLNGTVQKKTSSVIISTVFSVLAFVLIIYFSYEKTTQFFTMGLQYGQEGLLIYWGCLLSFFILAAYFREYGTVNKVIYTLLAIYFGFPRVYQVMYSIKNGYLFDGIVYLVLAVVILGGYSVLALHVGSQKGGIVGYK